MLAHSGGGGVVGAYGGVPPPGVGSSSSREVPNAAKQLQRRELDVWSSRPWMSAVARSRFARLGLSGCKFFKPTHHGNVNALDLDRAERRYLLAGAGDTSVAVYDTQATPSADGEEDRDAVAPGDDLPPLFLIHKSTTPNAHRFMLSAVAWYPVDTGLFVTGAYDNTVKVWDTNTLDVVGNFSLPAKVSHLAFSPIATSHCLVAVTCLEQNVRLCDPLTGAFTHTLSGHREVLWSVAWSNTCEYQLWSGDALGQVRLWDIRRSGCLATLDQYATQRTTIHHVQQRQREQQQEEEEEEEQEQALLLAAAASGRGGRGGEGSGRARGHDRREQQPKAKKHKSGSALSSGSQLHSNPAIAAALSSLPPVASPSAAAVCKAHNGAVTCIMPAPNGLHLLTAGTDDRLRLWDSHHLINRLVNYPRATNRAVRARQCAVSDDSSVVFYPSGNVVQVYDTVSGALVHTLSHGHFEPINCCAYSPDLCELYTGANDNRILVWSVQQQGSGKVEEEEEQGGARRTGGRAHDNWDD